LRLPCSHRRAQEQRGGFKLDVADRVPGLNRKSGLQQRGDDEVVLGL
jgi:hypothetical protein